MNILYLKRLIGTQVLAQAGDEHIEAAAQEVIVVSPDLLQNVGALEDLVGVFRKQPEQVGLLLGKLKGFFALVEGKVLVVEFEKAQPEPSGRVGGADLAAAQENFDFEDEFFDAERLGDVVVRSEAEPAQAVFFQGFCRQKKYGNLRVVTANLFSYRKPVYFGQHDVENAEVKILLMYSLQRLFAIRAMGYFIPLQFEVIPGYETQAFIIFNV